MWLARQRDEDLGKALPFRQKLRLQIKASEEWSVVNWRPGSWPVPHQELRKSDLTACVACQLKNDVYIQRLECSLQLILSKRCMLQILLCISSLCIAICQYRNIKILQQGREICCLYLTYSYPVSQFKIQTYTAKTFVNNQFVLLVIHAERYSYIHSIRYQCFNHTMFNLVRFLTLYCHSHFICAMNIINNRQAHKSVNV